MSAGRCIRCGRWWAFAANPALFTVICRWCPLCVPLITHIWEGRK